MLWLGIGFLSALAALLCLPPRHRALAPTEAPAADAQDVVAATNVALYRDYAEELAADTHLSAAERESLLADKARALLADSDQARLAAGVTGTLPPWATALTLATVVIGAVALYLTLGTPSAPQLAGARTILSIRADAPDAETQLRAQVTNLRQHLASNPDDANSWYLVGVGELKTGAYRPAVEAFARAHAFVGPDANLDLFWLQALFLAEGGVLTPQTQEIVQRVFARDPNQPTVLELLAVTAFRAGEHAQAVSFLNRALSGELSPEQRRTLTAGLAQARTSLGVPGAAVDVALQLSAPPPATATLFVIARPVGGGMPFAVVRRPVAGMPASVRLDDAVSMNPANPLSAAEQFEVVARLSLTGSPMAGAGDWEWRSAPLVAASGLRSVRAELSPPDP